MELMTSLSRAGLYMPYGVIWGDATDWDPQWRRFERRSFFSGARARARRACTPANMFVMHL